MSGLARTVRNMNFTQTNSPEVLGFAQKIFGMVGSSELFALPRWGLVVGLTGYWFIEPDFSRFAKEPEETAEAAPAE